MLYSVTPFFTFIWFDKSLLSTLFYNMISKNLIVSLVCWFIKKEHLLLFIKVGRWQQYSTLVILAVSIPFLYREVHTVNCTNEDMYTIQSLITANCSNNYKISQQDRKEILYRNAK